MLDEQTSTYRLASVTHLRSDRLSSVTEWSLATEQMHFWMRALHVLGGTSSCVISPACTQNRCSSWPLYRSHRQTAKSTPPDSR